MKRLSFVFIVMIVLLTCSLSVSASLVPTGPTTEKADSFFETWSAYSRVEKLLKDNYAFVDGEDTSWVLSEKKNMGGNAYIQDGEMYIPASFASEVFGYNSADTYAKLSDIASKKGLSLFLDPVGFAMLSEDENMVNTSVSDTAKGYNDYYSVSDAIGFITWEDVSESEFDREAYISKWQGLLTIPAGYSGDAVDKYKQYIPRIAVGNGGVYAKLNLDETKGNVPFTDINLNQYLDGTTNDIFNRNKSEYTSSLATCYENLLTLAKYYKYFDSSNTALRDDILCALDYLLKNHYSGEINRYNKTSADDSTARGSWTVYQLSIPFDYSNILCLMSNDMTQAEINAHTNAIFDRTIDPTVRNAGTTYEYYTNRLWRALGYFNTAVLANDYDRMNYALRYLNQVFTARPDQSELTYPENGFYNDGSFIFHGSLAYNLGYGDNYLVTVAEMILLTEDTPFSIEKVHGFENIYGFLEKNFYPFFSDNTEMKMVVGRSNALGDGFNVIRSALNIIRTAEPEKQAELLTELKTSFYKYLGNYENFDELTYTGDYNVISAAARDIAFLENMQNLWYKAETLPPEDRSDVFYNMDRALWRSGGYTAALAMSSERVMKYEATLSENPRGWYTGDGMLYIYTGDQKQYTKVYFENVNALRLPGTTVDETLRKEVATENGLMSDNAWAGGATDGKSAVCGYELSNAPLLDVPEGIQVQGRKSYFFLNGRVICIGSGISGGDGEVCTVVDNRLIDLK